MCVRRKSPYDCDCATATVTATTTTICSSSSRVAKEGQLHCVKGALKQRIHYNRREVKDLPPPPNRLTAESSPGTAATAATATATAIATAITATDHPTTYNKPRTTHTLPGGQVQSMISLPLLRHYTTTHGHTTNDSTPRTARTTHTHTHTVGYVQSRSHGRWCGSCRCSCLSRRSPRRPCCS